jgi:hypothetical protein
VALKTLHWYSMVTTTLPLPVCDLTSVMVVVVLQKLSSAWHVDGIVVVWVVVAKTGLIQLKGHNKTITSLHFCAPKNNHRQQQDKPLLSSLDLLLSTSLDGMQFQSRSLALCDEIPFKDL